MQSLPIFIGVTAAAVLLQAIVLIGILVVLKKTGNKVESLAEEVRLKALPALESAGTLLTNSRPEVEEIISNVHAGTSLIRGQIERLDSTVNDVIDRTRLQVIRADEMVTRTMDRMEQATNAVNTVVSPARQISGLMQGVTVGLNAFFRSRGRRRSGDGANVQQDELFI